MFESWQKSKLKKRKKKKWWKKKKNHFRPVILTIVKIPGKNEYAQNKQREIIKTALCLTIEQFCFSPLFYDNSRPLLQHPVSKNNFTAYGTELPIYGQWRSKRAVARAIFNHNLSNVKITYKKKKKISQLTIRLV